ncbi:MAG: hypothetical protein V4726_06150 [Verrucomicrobiota bacterium]
MGKLLRGIVPVFSDEVTLRGHALSAIVAAYPLITQDRDNFPLIQSPAKQKVKSLPGVLFSPGHDWQKERVVFDFIVINLGENFLLLKDIPEAEQLAVNESGLEIGEPEIETGVHEIHLSAGYFDPVIAQDTEPGSQIGVRRETHSAFPAGDGFARVQRKRSHVPESAGVLTALISAEGAGGILDHFQPVLSRDRSHLVNITTKTKFVDWQDGTRPCRYGGFDPGGIDIESPFLDVHKNRGGPGKLDNVGCGDVGKSGDNNLISRTDAKSPQRKLQSGGAVDGGDSMGCSSE